MTTPDTLAPSRPAALSRVYDAGTLYVCEVCTFAAVNGDDIRHDDAPDGIYGPDPAPWALYAPGPYDVAARAIVHAPNFDSETGDGMRDFSSADCQGCGNRYAGARYRFATLTPLAVSTASPALPGGLTYLTAAGIARVIIDETTPRNPYAYGYGRRIPTRYRLTLADGITRRVYAMCYGNSASLYVTIRGTLAHIGTDAESVIESVREISERTPALASA